MKKEFELPNGINLDYLLTKVRELSWGAADILKAYAKGAKPPYGFPQAMSVSDGGDGPVTAADLAVNTWLIDGLLSPSFPESSWSLISEESFKEKSFKTIKSDHEWIWIIDPLDGTKDFLEGTGEYAVHLALFNCNKLYMGIVLIPEAEEIWFGVTGLGAWCEDRSAKRQSFSFSDRFDISDLKLVSSRNHIDERLEKLIKSIPISQTQSVGSVGCKIAKILKGEADFYISLSGKSAPKDWDMAAPEAVLRAAGGKLTHANNKPVNYITDDVNQWGCLIASHGKSHERLCKLIEEKLLKIDPNFVV